MVRVYTGSQARCSYIQQPPPRVSVDDHQTFNAQYLSDNGAAILIQQSALSVEKTSEILQKLTRESCLTMAKNARALAKPEAAVSVAKICMSLAGMAT